MKTRNKVILVLGIGMDLLTPTSILSQPGLTLEQVEAGWVRISWSIGDSPFVLEAANSLSDATPFRPVPVPVTNDQGRASALISTRKSTRFFRLRASDFSLSLKERTSVRAGGAIALKPEHLSATKTGTAPGEIVYTLGGEGYSALFTGFLSFTNAPDEKITRFTQADIDAGRVIYRDGIKGKVLPEMRADVFSFSISIGPIARAGREHF